MDKFDRTIKCITREGERERLAWTSECVLEWEREILEVVREPEV